MVNSELTIQPVAKQRSTNSTNLDILRASAVLMVITAHLLEAFGLKTGRVVLLGHAGVMMFFVHTSFVLMQSMERMHSESPRRLALRFYVRRAFRIYPLAMFVVLSLTACVYAFPWAMHQYFASYRPGIFQLITNCLLVQNIFGPPDILLVMWSLAFEVQMYAVFPICFRLRAINPIDSLVVWAGLVMSLAFIPLRLFQLLQYVPCFFPGVIAYCYSTRSKHELPSPMFLVITFTWVLAYISLGSLNPFFAMFLCLALGLTIPHFRDVSWKPLATVGASIAQYSYGIYLIHTSCIFSVFLLFNSASWMMKLVAFTLLLSLSTLLLFHCIERPFMKIGAVASEAMLFLPRKHAALMKTENACERIIATHSQS